MAAAAGGRFRELLRKYGKVALGVHFSVSAASITGLYVAINNNVDVESMLDKVGMGGVSSKKQPEAEPQIVQQQKKIDDGDYHHMSEIAPIPPPEKEKEKEKKKKNRTAELVTSSGGALALAFLCNKALIPVRVPITIALTPPIARFLARRSSTIIHK